jgi:ABC-type lipoprotein release transport system permease subunit
MYWKIAWRNLWRHRGRTIITTSAVALTYAIMLIGMGINDDGHGRMLKEAAEAAGGEVIVHARGYWNSRASDLVIRDADSVVSTVRSVDGVRAVMRRVLLNGLVSSSAAARPIHLRGIDVDDERELADPSDDLVDGTFLTGDETDPLVLGARLVEDLELQLGDRVVLTASDPDGEVTRALFHLSGVFRTGTRELDEGIGYTSIAAAQRAVSMEGMLTQIGVLGAHGSESQSLAQSIAGRLDGEQQSLEALSWQESVPEMVGYVELDSAFGLIYMAIILLVVLFSIANTFLMAVLERVREFGLLSALGLRQQRVAQLLLTETVLMTAVAMGIGFVVGYGGHLAVAHWGIPLSAWGLDEMELSGIDFADLVIYSQITPFKWIIGSIGVALATIASSLYPAWRAGRLAPAEAMRFFE